MSDSNLDYESFIPQLLDEVPPFEPIYSEHLSDFGELLPYLLMGDFTRFVYDTCRRSTSGEVHSEEWSQVLQTSLRLMERAINSPDERLETLIGLGFVETSRHQVKKM